MAHSIIDALRAFERDPAAGEVARAVYIASLTGRGEPAKLREAFDVLNATVDQFAKDLAYAQEVPRLLVLVAREKEVRRGIADRKQYVIDNRAAVFMWLQRGRKAKARRIESEARQAARERTKLLRDLDRIERAKRLLDEIRSKWWGDAVIATLTPETDSDARPPAQAPHSRAADDRKERAAVRASA